MDFDKAFEVVKGYQVIPPSEAGLKAELLFYHTYYTQFQLEPLLDAGVKADFSATRNNVSVNIDVTTNLDYKDINKYADVMQRKRKNYEIALVDTKSEEIQFFPLRFPICKNCGLFSHYVLFYARPMSEVVWSQSANQALIRYCPNCENYQIVTEYSYYAPSLLLELNEQLSLQSPEENLNPEFNADEFIRQESIMAVQSFESESQKIISAFTEGDYIITDPRDGDGFYGGRILWTHPLAEKWFSDIFDFDYP
ncbi:MAG: hypothetical protein ACOWW1_07410 [archaeon]